MGHGSHHRWATDALQVGHGVLHRWATDRARHRKGWMMPQVMTLFYCSCLEVNLLVCAWCHVSYIVPACLPKYTLVSLLSCATLDYSCVPVLVFVPCRFWAYGTLVVPLVCCATLQNLCVPLWFLSFCRATFGGPRRPWCASRGMLGFVGWGVVSKGGRVGDGLCPRAPPWCAI